MTTQQQALDLEQIREVKARYTRYLDSKRWKLYESCFTDDVRTHRGVGPEIFARGVAEHLDGVVSVHQVHAPWISFTGEGAASGRWLLFDYNENLNSPRVRLGKQGYGYYHEDYERRPNGWQISATRLSRIRQDQLSKEPLDLLSTRGSAPESWLESGRPTASFADLAEAEAIRHLTFRALRHLDRKQWTSLREALSAPATLDFGTGEARVEGADAIVAALRERFADATTVHHAHTSEIRWLDREARALWALSDLVSPLPGAALPGQSGRGHLAAAYAREAGAWKITALTIWYLRRDPLAPADRLTPVAGEVAPDWLAGWPVPDPATSSAVQELLDAKSRFSYQLIAKEWSAWRQLFAPDARIDVGDGLQRDVDALFAGPLAVHQHATVVQHVHAPEIRVAGDRARALWSVEDYWEHGGQLDRVGARQHSVYEEEYIQADGAWRLSSLRIVPHCRVSLSGPALGPYTDRPYR